MLIKFNRDEVSVFLLSETMEDNEVSVFLLSELVVEEYI